MKRGILIILAACLLVVAGCTSANGSGGNQGLAPEEIANLGDSITWRAGSALPGVTLARGGWTTTELLRQVPEVLARNPKIKQVRIMVGINDITLRRGVAATYSNYIEIIERYRAAGVEVVVQSTLCVCTPGWSGYAKLLSAKLYGYCLANGIKFIDLWPTFCRGNVNQVKEYFHDCTHLSKAGINAWVRVLKAAL